MNDRSRPVAARNLLAPILLGSPDVDLPVDRVAEILALAADLNVAPTFCARLPRSTRNALPAELRDRIENVVEGSAARNTLLLAEAAELSRKLDAVGIEHVFIKGAALLGSAYEAIGERAMNDLDVWVRPTAIERARDCLLAAGFDDTAADHTTPDGGTLRDFRADNDHEELPLVSPDGTVVDLHRHFPDVEPVGAFDLDVVLARCVRVAVPGGIIPVPARVDTLAHICAHVFAHHFGGRTLVTRHLADLAAVIGSRAISSEQVAQLTGGAAGSSVAWSIRLLHAAAATHRTVLDDALLAFAIPSTQTADSVQWVQDSALLARRLLRDLRHNPRRFASRVFPARSWMATAYGVGEDSPVIPALYLWRIATWPFPSLRRETR